MKNMTAIELSDGAVRHLLEFNQANAARLILVLLRIVAARVGVDELVDNWNSLDEASVLLLLGDCDATDNAANNATTTSNHVDWY